jgi:hypothetical protein
LLPNSNKSLGVWDPDCRSWAAGRHLHLNKLCRVCGQTLIAECLNSCGLLFFW